ncbi:MAG: MFS transporter [Phycisphaerae bacterium]|jgi:MFS family permease
MIAQFLNLSRTVHLLCLGAFINRAGTFIAPFLTLYLEDELELGVGFATRAMGVYGVGALLAYFTGGQLADQIGRRIVMLVSLVGTAAILLLFAHLRSGWSILGALLAFSFIAEMYRPACSAMIADVTGPEQRTHAFGLMYVAINLGFAVATSVGGFLAQYSYEWLFWGDALTAFLFAVLIFVTIKETLPSRRRSRDGVDRWTPDDAVCDDVEASAPMREAAAHILSNGTFLACWVAAFFVAASYVQALSTFPLYLNQLGFGAKEYGRLIALNGVLIVIFQLPVTMIVAKYHRGTMVIASAVIVGVGFGLTGLATTGWHFALTIVVWTFGEIMHAPLMPAIVADLSPSNMRGRYMGVFTVCFSCSMMVGAPLGGVVLDKLGGGWLWGGTLMIGLVSASVFAAVRRQIAVPTTDDPPTEKAPAVEACEA